MKKVVNRKYEESIYIKIAMQDLILFSIYSVTKNGEICTFERLVAEGFTNFPKIFGFKRYPQWPDSLRFARPIRTLRERGLITGSSRTYFQLTEAGRKKALQTEEALSINMRRSKKRPPIGNRSIDDRLIAYIRNSHLFNAFLKDPQGFSITEWEFRELLKCTLESSIRVLKENLNYYKEVAQKYNEQQVLEFLSYCERNLLGGKRDG